MSACKGMNCGCTDGVSHSVECRAEYAAAAIPVTACECTGNLTPLFDSEWKPIRMENGILVCPACGENPFGISGTSTRARGGSEC